MKLPKTIMMAGIEHDVELKDGITNALQQQGYFYADQSKIVISSDLKNKGLIKNTLIHEIIEAANYHYELKLEHNQITALASALNETGLFFKE